jgi:hypothetical protein
MKDDNEFVVEDLTTLATEFPMLVKIPSSYMKTDALQYNTGGQPLFFYLGTTTYSYLDRSSGNEMYYISLFNNSTITLQQEVVQRILRVEGEKKVPIEDKTNNDGSSDLARESSCKESSSNSFDADDTCSNRFASDDINSGGPQEGHHRGGGLKDSGSFPSSHKHRWQRHSFPHTLLAELPHFGKQ